MKNNNRLLGAFEKLLWVLDQHIPTHFVMAAEIEGQASIAEWQSTLINLQKRHPLFSVCITGNEHTEIRFKTVEKSPITLRIVNDDQADNLQRELERELATPFDTTKGPLIRAVLIEKERNSTLIFAIHHAIGDGISLVLVIKDLLNLLHKKTLDPLPMPPSIDDLLNINNYKEENTDDLKTELMVQVPSINDQRISIASPIVDLIQLGPDFTAKLLKNTKQRGTTVYGAVSAALILAGKQLYPDGKGKTIRFITPISIRETLNLKEGSSLCITNKFHAVEPSQSLTFWDTARHIKSNLDDTKTIGYIKAGTEELRALVFSGGLTVKEGARLMENQFDHEFIISNLGVTPYGTTFGAFKLKTIWGPMQFNANPIEHSIGVATTNGVVSITYASRAPLKDLLPVMKQILQLSCS